MISANGNGMKKTIGLCIVLLVLCLTGCHKAEQSKETLTLFVAASLTDVIQEIGDEYKKDRPVEIVYNFASSGALAQQLLASPRADLFLSASEKWMDAVENDGKLKEDTRKTFLSNHLVVIANAKSDYALNTPIEFAALPFRFLSIGDPASVPAGRYARSWLSSVNLEGGSNLWDQVSNRISPAPDVRSALIQVEGSSDVVGIVYETDYKVRPEGLRLLYRVPTGEGPKISYAVGILNETQLPDLAQDFLNYLATPEVSGIFEKYGFEPLK